MKRNMINEKDKIFLRKFSAMAIGNTMEWFDFSAFGALIDVIAANFFPSSESHMIQLLQSLSFFGAAFIMRPFGGVLMGYIGDKINRKKALEISILMMFFPSLLIGVLPTYNTAGYYSYVALLLLRLIQGLAAGGELIGAYLYTLESCDGKNVGFWGGACKASGNFGTTLGVGLVTVLRSTLTKEQLYSWGWRLPFICSLLFGIAGLVARVTLKDDEHDSLDYEDKLIATNSEGHDNLMVAKRKEYGVQKIIPPPSDTTKSPIEQVWNKYHGEVMVIMLASSFWACSYYTAFVWLVYYMQDPELIGGNGVASAWRISFVANFCLVIALPIGGRVGDVFGLAVGDSAKGALYAMELACFLMIILVIPAFLCIMTRESGYALFGQFLFLAPVSIYGANLPYFMMSMIDCKKLRYTAMGIGYNLSHALFTSTTSLIQTTLIVTNFWFIGGGQQANQPTEHHRPLHLMLSDSRLRPALYLILIAMLAFLTLSIGVARCQQKRLERKQYESLVGNLDDTLQDSDSLKEAISIQVIHADCRDIRDDESQQNGYEKAPSAPVTTNTLK